LVGLPLLAALIITLLGKASSLAKAGRGSSSTSTGTPSSAGVTDPVWLGNAPESKELTEGTTTQTETGGASARW
jgi:hypothetical protein